MKIYRFLLTALALVGCDAKEEDDPGTASGAVDGDGDGFTADLDCDDGNSAVFPGAGEICDSIDNDCDGTLDDDPTDGTEFYADNDGDGYGTSGMTAMFCGTPGEGYADNADDCDDTFAAAYPGGAELCDGADNDCDGDIDNDTGDLQAFYADADGDGYGDPGASVQACAAPANHVTNDDDCEDGDASVNPNSVWYPDADGDGYGDDLSATFTGCEAPFLYVAVRGDCDDDSFETNPDAEEVCNALDDDCDGTVPADEYDGDGDGAPACGTDCDDTNATAYEGAAELCNDGIDNNCDSVADESCAEAITSAADVRVAGVSSSDYLGRSISSGDVNGDGVDDLVLGAYYADAPTTTYGGQVYTIYGPLTAGASLSASNDDATLSGTTQYAYFGYQTRADSDIDGDGYDEIITTAYATSSYAGAAYVYYGPTTSDALDTGADAKITGAAASDYLGSYKFETGDFDGDGDDDVITNAYQYDIGSITSVGVIAVFDEPSGTLDVTDADAAIYGSTSYGYLGYSMDVGGDANGDGIADVAYGEYYYDIAYLIYGPLTGDRYDYRDADVAMIGNSSSYGASALESGDLNGDGYDDYVFGSYYDSTGISSGGAVYIVHGPINSDIDVGSDFGARIYGTTSYDYLGSNQYGSVRAEDMDGDGTDDLILSNYYTEPAGSSLYSTGALWMFYGPVEGDMAVSTAFDRGYYTSTSYTYMGLDSGVADLDDDGMPDLFTGAYGATSYAGEAYVIFNSSL